MAVVLIVTAVVYFVQGETRDAVVLALALIPVLGADVLLEARTRAGLEKLAAGSPLRRTFCKLPGRANEIELPRGARIW